MADALGAVHPTIHGPGFAIIETVPPPPAFLGDHWVRIPNSTCVFKVVDRVLTDDEVTAVMDWARDRHHWDGTPNATVVWGPYDVTHLTDDELAALEAGLCEYYGLTC